MKTIDFTNIDSTSLYLKRNYQEIENFTFVSSLYQSQGKGRNVRKWESEPGKNLLFSLIIKDKEVIEKFTSLSLISAYCIYNVIKSLNIEDVSIKWPNDIYIKDKKVCGILLEGISCNNELLAIVIGVGLNVNQQEFATANATSLYLNSQIEYQLNEIKQKVYQEFIKQIDLFKNGCSQYLSVVKENNYLKDKQVYATYNGNKIEVKVLDINDDNSLKVLYNNTVLSLSSGEISFHLQDREAY